MVGRQSRQAQQSATGRNIGPFNQLTDFFLRAAKLNPLSDKDKRTFRVVYQCSRLTYRPRVGLGYRHITANEIRTLRFVVHQADLRILGKVQHDRSRPAALGNIKGTAYRPSHIFRTTDLIGPFADGLRHTYQVAFLKGIRPQQRSTDLPGNHHDGRTVHHGIRNTGNGVRRPRPAGHQSHPDLARHTGIPLCRMGSPLFMPYQYMVQLIFISVQGVIYRHDSSARIAEERRNPLVLQRTHQSLCACYLFFCHIENCF